MFKCPACNSDLIITGELKNERFLYCENCDLLYKKNDKSDFRIEPVYPAKGKSA